MLSPLQEKILHSIAYYKYLTTSQLIDIGVSKNRRSICNAVRDLKDPKRKYLGDYSETFEPGIGRLETFHFLTAKGKRLLKGAQSYNGTIDLHRGTSNRLPREYFHRRYTIDCHIAIEKRAKEY